MARILIIDDDSLVRQALVLMLEHESHEVMEAANGREAIRIMRQWQPDLVITDIIMPETDGFETIRELRNTAAELKIIAISGGDPIGTRDILEIAREFGADAAFGKPIDRQEFLSSVSRLLAAT